MTVTLIIILENDNKVFKITICNITGNCYNQVEKIIDRHKDSVKESNDAGMPL